MPLGGVGGLWLREGAGVVLVTYMKLKKNTRGPNTGLYHTADIWNGRAWAEGIGGSCN